MEAEWLPVGQVPAGGERHAIPVVADPATQRVFAMAARVSGTRATVLIGGPSGTGKEVLARYVHQNSARSTGPFVAVNCAALPETMLEALLFGHERGAFTGAAGAAPGLVRAAEGGTLFLDEIAELPLPLQAKLLRVLQEREVLPLGATRPVPVDLRLIAATNRELAAEVTAGRFRDDLYWRIAVFPIQLPPLAQRPADILPLARHFLATHAEAAAPPTLQADAEAALLAHAWPGNVRELGNVIERAIILAGSGPISAGHLSLPAPPASRPPFFQPHPLPPASLTRVVKAREAEEIRAALELAGGRRAQAARHLGISERTLRYKLAALAGRPRHDGRPPARSVALAGGSLQ